MQRAAALYPMTSKTTIAARANFREVRAIDCGSSAR